MSPLSASQLDYLAADVEMPPIGSATHLQGCRRRSQSLPGPLRSREGGFTLMEIVLAIALTAVVMYLLTTAIELYLVRVDSSRSRVESAQLARTLLDQIAADLSATRMIGPAGGGASGQQTSGGQGTGGGGQNGGGAQFGSGSSGQGTGGNNGGGQFGPSQGGAGGGSTLAAPPSVQGLFGTLEEVRIDRAARPNWQRAAREVAAEETSTVDDWPTTVRYYFVDGDRMTSQELAERGISSDATQATATGLYREVIPTAALSGSASADPLPSPAQRDDAKVEFLAPEVVKFELAYADGEQLVETWDSGGDGGLPGGVEIRITIYQPALDPDRRMREAESRLDAPRYAENELVEYRRFLRLPKAPRDQPADQLLPVQQNAGGNGGLSTGQGQGDDNETGGGNGGG